MNSFSQKNSWIPHWLVRLLLATIWLPLSAAADCAVPPDATGFKYSDEARDVRDDLYEDMCRESTIPVVIASDPKMKSRLELPSKGHRLVTGDIYPEKAKRLSFEGAVVVAIVIETDGSIKHARVIQSSGHAVLDYAVTTFWKQYQFDIPGKLDGAPARFLYEQQMNFRLKGPAIGLPASFSDKAINGLGDRILQPYERSDANALYQDLDETVKSNMSAIDIQNQFAEYTSRFGDLPHFQYLGLMGVKNTEGISHYKLMYLVECTKCHHGAATLIITALDRPDRPGISSFEIMVNNNVKLK
jgi:TonB family protein